MKRNTLDIDPIRMPNGYLIFPTANGLKRIIQKIGRCRGLVYLHTRLSPSGNGYHVEFWCQRDCDSCRMVYDHPRRFRKDLQRPSHSRDVIWGSKPYVKGGRVVVLSAGDWR